jgi:HEPN domain-containing protein
MNRVDLQKLSNTRIREAQILFRAGEYSGAYYLAGYAVECALKACFAKGVQRYDFPDKGRSDRVFNHDFKALASLARVKDNLDADTKINPTFAACWAIVYKWSEESRYSLGLNKGDAEEILDAILRRKDGVLSWIKQRW